MVDDRLIEDTVKELTRRYQESYEQLIYDTFWSFHCHDCETPLDWNRYEYCHVCAVNRGLEW